MRRLNCGGPNTHVTNEDDHGEKNGYRRKPLSTATGGEKLGATSTR